MSKKERNRIRRQRAADKTAQAAFCPTPNKVPFPDAATAITALVRHGRAGQGWGVYECRCSFVHLTSRPGPLLREFSPTG